MLYCTQGLLRPKTGESTDACVSYFLCFSAWISIYVIPSPITMYLAQTEHPAAHFAGSATVYSVLK